MTVTKEEIDKIKGAIFTAKKLGACPPIKLRRYLGVLIRLQHWEHKLKVASNRVTLYKAKKKYYDKWLMPENGQPKTQHRRRRP